MFRFEGFCDDKVVVALHRALAGIGNLYDVKVVPVLEAKARNGKVVSAEPIAGLTPQLSAVARQLHSGDRLTNADLVGLMKKAGMATNSITHVQTRLIKAKILRRVKKGVFDVRTSK
jgi:hypothetical protein